MSRASVFNCRAATLLLVAFLLLWNAGWAAAEPLATKPSPRPPTARAPAKAPIKPDAAKAEQARIEAACVRYRLVWGMDCPTENGSGAGGVDPLKDVRRLGTQPPAKK